MTIYITLTAAGIDLGPFDLYSDVDSYTTAFETGVTRTAVLAGYTSTLAPNGTANIKLVSTGLCTNDLTMAVSTTTTTTTTAAPVYKEWQITTIGRSSAALACAEILTSTKYTDASVVTIDNGAIIYNDITLLNAMSGADLWWSEKLGGEISFQMNNLGVVSGVDLCATLPSVTISTTTSITLDCALPIDSTAYISSQVAGVLTSGDIMCTDSIGTPMVGNSDFYTFITFFATTVTHTARIGAGGQITSITDCP